MSVAAAFTAGADLTPGTTRPNGTLTDYYELENSSPVDDSFLEGRLSAAYNDQTRIISTATLDEKKYTWLYSHRTLHSSFYH